MNKQTIYFSSHFMCIFLFCLHFALIIKNIKRNLTNSKTIIYESELSQTKYQYYTTLIKEFTETLV